MQPSQQGLQSPAIAATKTYVSDLKPTFAMNGWGSAHLDKSNGEQGTPGNTLSIRGKTYAKGLGVHATSEVDVPLNGKYSQFVSDIGVDDEKNGLGKVDFQVVADGQQIFDSGVVSGTDPVKSVDVDVSGKQNLKLIVKPGANGIDNDHADWAGAMLLSSDPNTSTPPPNGSGSGGTTPPPQSSTPPPQSSGGSTYYVATTGNDSGDGSINRPWKTINHAVAADSAVKAGDTILVQPGTYTEQVTLGKSGNSTNGNITLKANGDVTLVDPNPTGGQFEDGTIQSTGKSFWDINGFTIKNSPWAGIALHDAHNMTVENNHTEQTGSSGIIVLPGSYYGGGDAEVTSSNVKVLNNTINQANHRYYEGTTGVGGQESLSIWGVDGFEVAGNKVTNGNTEGIDIKVGSRNGSVHNNEVSGVAAITGRSRHSGPAIYIDGNRANESNIDIYSNYLHDNHADGISLADEAPNQGSVSNIKIHDNTVTNNGILGINGGEGVDIASDVSHVEIYHNKMDGNLQSFWVDGTAYGGPPATDINIHDNQFLNNKYQNGYVGDKINGMKLVNNVFSGGFGTSYAKSGTQTNFQDSGNTSV